MKKLNLFVILLLLCSMLFGQNPGMTGSYGLFHTHSGRIFEPGRLEIRSNMNFYTKLPELIGASSVSQSAFSAANWWVVAANMGVTYGISQHFDATTALRIYQDTNQENVQNLPDDLAEIVAVWPELPEHIKAAIKALVKTHIEST